MVRAIELATLAPLARWVIAARRPVVIGITGSAGKSTTKEIVGRTLADSRVRPFVGSVWRTQGNLNANRSFVHLLLGTTHSTRTLPQRVRALLTAALRAFAYVFRLRAYPRVLVLEYATSRPGNIGWRTGIVRPHVAVVTTVGPAHLAQFGSVERIADEKADLARAALPDGLVLLGADNAHTVAMQAVAGAPCQLVPGAGRSFAEAVTRIIGGRLGVPAEVLEAALKDAGAIKGRQDVQTAGALTVIDDAHNANPLSMRYGLDQLAARHTTGQRRVAVLGEMLELGDEARDYHEQIGRHARTAADVVIGVGTLAQLYAPDHWFPTSEACAAAVPSLVRAGDVVFVKGSNSVRLGQVVRALQETADGAGQAVHTNG